MGVELRRKVLFVPLRPRRREDKYVSLALGGVDGVVHVLRSLLAEADLILGIDGYASLKDLTADALRRVDAAEPSR